MAVTEGGAAGAIHAHKFSTVVPGSVTGDNVVHELTNMDLAVKMHYLRGVYYFATSDVVEGLTITAMKEPMFPLLDIYYAAAGRVRRAEPGGRPFVKCNDCGVRIIEAKCNQTIGEWLTANKPSQYRQLVSDKVVGPDLQFSPTVLIQFTKFKCGGLAVGLSWAHLLGDIVTATNFINLWGQLLSSKSAPKHLQTPHEKTKKATEILPDAPKPLSVQQVEPVGDCWLAPCSCTMATFSFHITEERLKHIESKASIKTLIPPFEALAALFWQCIAYIRGGEPKLATVCRSNSGERSGILRNDQIVSTVAIDFSPVKAELSEIAMSIARSVTDEKKAIEALIDKASGTPDVILYGANLTFVDLQQVDLDGLELKSQKPIHVEYSIDGVGEEGAVLVQRGCEATGRIVTVILPEVQVSQLREVLGSEWTIA